MDLKLKHNNNWKNPSINRSLAYLNNQKLEKIWEISFHKIKSVEVHSRIILKKHTRKFKDNFDICSEVLHMQNKHSKSKTDKKPDKNTSKFILQTNGQ